MEARVGVLKFIGSILGVIVSSNLVEKFPWHGDIENLRAVEIDLIICNLETI